jgi:uncharacterized protein YlzI (FlbEa/FlbD family)
MSASLSWVPKPEREENFFGRGSSLEKAISETFGALPVTLNHDHIEKLEVIKNCGYEDINEVINAIYKYGRVEINSHY